MKTPVEIMLDQVEMTPVEKQQTDDGIPYVTHEGKLQIGESVFTVYLLSNGKRIIPADELETFFIYGTAPMLDY